MQGEAFPFHVSCETSARLNVFADLLTKWTRRINLVAPTTVARLWERHINDSAQLVECCPTGAHKWADLGTGGGLPGVVIAILASELRPELSVTCVEADQRKAAFLRTVSRETCVPFEVRAARAEAIAPLAADVVSARALAPLPRLLDLAVPHMAGHGVGLFPKGERSVEEVAAARKLWRFDLQRITSITDPKATILRLENVARA